MHKTRLYITCPIVKQINSNSLRAYFSSLILIFSCISIRVTGARMALKIQENSFTKGAHNSTNVKILF